jgi:hypothetical protein
MTKNLTTLAVAGIMALSLSTGAALADNSKRGVGNGKGKGAATAAANASDKAKGGFGVEDDAVVDINDALNAETGAGLGF